MRKKKNTDPCDLQEKEFKKQLAEVEFPDCNDGQSKRENEMIELLKILIKNSEEIKEILLQLKNRFI